MELKQWTYDEFPGFDQPVEGAAVIHTTGDETNVTYHHDVEFVNANGTPLHLQIMRPYSRNTPKRPLPCVVFVQGSGWLEQYCYFNVVQLGQLAARGFVCAIVQYRHSGIAPFPAQIEDALNAVRFLRKNAEEYGVDPENMILAGDSSGGHTAVYASMFHNDATPQNLFPGVSGEVKGVVDYYGAVTVMQDDGFPSTPNAFEGDTPEGKVLGSVDLRQNPDLRRRFSVPCVLDANTAIPPVLIFHGTKDRTVNCTQSVELYRHMKSLGKPAELYLLEGADHGGAEFWTPEVLDIVEKFCRGCF